MPTLALFQLQINPDYESGVLKEDLLGEAKNEKEVVLDVGDYAEEKYKIDFMAEVWEGNWYINHGIGEFFCVEMKWVTFSWTVQKLRGYDTSN